MRCIICAIGALGNLKGFSHSRVGFSCVGHAMNMQTVCRCVAAAMPCHNRFGSAEISSVLFWPCGMRVCVLVRVSVRVHVHVHTLHENDNRWYLTHRGPVLADRVRAIVVSCNQRQIELNRARKTNAQQQQQPCRASASPVVTIVTFSHGNVRTHRKRTCVMVVLVPPGSIGPCGI